MWPLRLLLGQLPILAATDTVRNAGRHRCNTFGFSLLPPVGEPNQERTASRLVLEVFPGSTRNDSVPNFPLVRIVLGGVAVVPGTDHEDCVLAPARMEEAVDCSV